MKAYFEERDVPEFVSPVVKSSVIPAHKAVFFHLERFSHGGAPPYEFDGLATEEHKKQYARQYGEFLKSKEEVKTEE